MRYNVTMPAEYARLTIRLRKDLHTELEVLALARGLSLNSLINEAVEEYIAKREAENREALLKAREALEQLRKEKGQASNPVNEE
jgi:predicted transcriptional regulator